MSTEGKEVESHTVPAGLLEELFERARRSEEISRNLFDIEIAILNIASTRAFFEHLYEQVGKKFTVPRVSLTLIQNPSNEPLVEALRHSDVLDGRWQQIPKVEYLAATQGERRPILASGPNRKLLPLVLPEDREGWGSMAILPLQLEGRLAGSLTLIDSNPKRYTPDMDAFFLYQLSVKASLSLSAVVARERADFLATRDPLTRLRNRRELEETLDREVSRCIRHGNALSLAFIDCDDFKQINDHFGHDVGDKYLQHMAGVIEEMIRKTDLAFRYAGDEFIILLPDQDSQGAAFTVERLLAHMAKNPLMLDDHPVPLRASVGVASAGEIHQPTPRALLKAADKALYEHKKRKQGRFAVSD